MSGTKHLPGGEPRKASQRKARRASPVTSRVNPRWRAGDGVQWQGRSVRAVFLLAGNQVEAT